jgi:hypothetical protein
LKKYIPLLAGPLVLSLFIYVFYRTDKTLINQAIISFLSREQYVAAKTTVAATLQLSNFLVYSLPEGLWIFCITITSSFFYINFGTRKCSLVYVPLLLGLFMEILQLLHVTHGRFDVIDVLFVVGFWLLARIITRWDEEREALFDSFNAKTLFCMTTYCIVYLAHVSY